MKTIVVGCGRVGAELAYRLYQKGHDVTVIDEREKAFQNLPTDFRGRTLEGDVLSEEMQHRCSMGQASGLAAVTNSDSLNAVVGHIARTVHQIPNVVVRNYDPRRRAFCEAFGLLVISSSSWGAQRMEEFLVQEPIRSVLATGNGDVEIYEILIGPQWQDNTVQELLADSAALPVALTRAAQTSLPTPTTKLVTGDRLQVSATSAGIAALRKQVQVT